MKTVSQAASPEFLFAEAGEACAFSFLPGS